MNELDVALQAARAGAAAIVRPTSIAAKASAIDLVTEVDRASERAIREVLGRHMPDVPVLGEEGGGDRAARAVWVVDPIDGTTNFVHGFPFYGVSVALQVDGRSEVGVVLDVVRDRAATARRGHGAFVGDVRLRVSGCRTLGDSLCATGFPAAGQARAAYYLRFVQAILERTRGIRRAGAASLDLAMTAEGALDVYWEFHLARWDVAAGSLLVEEAGGTVTNLDGHPLDRDDPCPLATNGHLHETMLALIAEVEQNGSASGSD